MNLVFPVIICLAALLTGCDTPAPPTDKYVGTWESHSFTMNVSRDGTTYLVNLDNHRGMLSGNYAGERVDGALKVTLPLSGEQLIMILPNGDHLEFIGEQLVRSPPGQSSGKSERRKRDTASP